MSQNYNLNSSFGLNVSTHGTKYRTGAPESVDISKNGNLFNSLTNYVDKYENVMNGDVEKEIGMYSRQAMFVGMSLKASDKTIRKFDVSI